MINKLFKFILSLFKFHKLDPIITDRIDYTFIKPITISKKTIPIQYKNESQRLKSDDTQLSVNNAYLHTLMSDLNDYTNTQFKKGIVITMIFRTPKEQDYLYRNSKKYKIKKFKSPHQFWHAVDIRSRTFTSQEIKQIVEWLNEAHNDLNYYKWTAKCHDVGSGMHFHIQFSY